MGISKRYDSQIMGRLHVSLRALQVYINWHDYKMVFSEEKTPVPHDFLYPQHTQFYMDQALGPSLAAVGMHAYT